MWPFECVGPNGQTYLHNDNWRAFLKEREVEYPHNWEHRRALLTLCMPSGTLDDIPGVTEDTIINQVENDFSTIFQPFPAHLRTGIDPDGRLDSWNIFVEDQHYKPLGEPIVLFSTSHEFFPSYYTSLIARPERFALFRGKYWRVWSVTGGGLGSAAPPVPPKKVELKPQYRSLDDDWA